MRGQEHNKGHLTDLNVKIEAEVVKEFMKMSSNSGITMDELVVIALKRFIASHSDYRGLKPSLK